MVLTAYAIINDGKILSGHPWGQLEMYPKKEQAEFILKDVRKKLPNAEIAEVDISGARPV
ncbi:MULTISPECIES: hypothetical protein [Pseudomonas]|uniref:Uncharacterized protein n=1 Tax=Pseudomonas fluorescens TaxID=294 RepID=A0A166QN26_PSEFL|nr:MULTISPECIES: hypothetical protein [Pseudomonas]KZN20563.1 hypothetical protein A1D17_03210 [Pseudomonas fluorescens]